MREKLGDFFVQRDVQIMSTGGYQCEFCFEVKWTAQGLRSHIAQSPVCLEKLTALSTPAENSDNDDKMHSDKEDIPMVIADTHNISEISDDFSDIDVDILGDLPVPQSPVQAQKRYPVEMEEVEDADDRWVQDYPGPAGTTKGGCKTTFQLHHEAQKATGDKPWAPFESEKEWELARWLMTSGISQKKIDSFLKLETVSNLLF